MTNPRLLINLWVDDTRVAPAGWTWAKNVDQAKGVLRDPSIRVGVASLDHDLGSNLWSDIVTDDIIGYDSDAPTGLDLVYWMVDNDIWPTISCAVHSANPQGAALMMRWIKDKGPYNSSTPLRLDLGKDGVVTGMTFLKGG